MRKPSNFLKMFSNHPILYRSKLKMWILFFILNEKHWSETKQAKPVVENVQFYAPKLQIAFSEALFGSIRTDLRLIEALQSLQIESRHLLDHWSFLRSRESCFRVTDLSIDHQMGSSWNRICCPTIRVEQRYFHLQFKILSHVDRTNRTGRTPTKKRMRSCRRRLKIGMQSILRCLNMKPTSDLLSGWSRTRFSQNSWICSENRSRISYRGSVSLHFTTAIDFVMQNFLSRLVSCSNT